MTKLPEHSPIAQPPDPSHGVQPSAAGQSSVAGPPDLLAEQHFPPPPRQARSRQKRAALLEAGLALFGEQGYEETTVEQIAQRAGVAVGGFYQHFSSKRQLLLVLMAQLLSEISTLLPTGANSASPVAPTSTSAPPEPTPGQDAPQAPSTGALRAGIAALVRRGLELDWGYAGAYRAWREAVVIDPDLRAFQAEIEAWSAQGLVALLRPLTQLPGARPSMDLITLCAILSALFWRLAQTPLDHPDAVIVSLTDLIVHAIFADSAGVA